MLNVLARNWWLLTVRGALAVLFGLAALIWPGVTLTVVVLIFAAFVLVDGIFALIAGVRDFGERRRWWALVLEGLAGIAFGVLAFIWPGITILALVYLIAAWALVTGVLEIAAAIALRRELTGEWLLALAGVLSIVLGVLVAIFPEAGAVGLIWLVGAYAIVFGAVLIALSLRLRGRRPQAAPPTL